jgi:hypothetical protein
MRGCPSDKGEEDQTQTQKRREDTEGRNRLAGVEGRKGG